MKKDQLFQWLDLALDGEVLPWTTSPLERGINDGIKDQLRLHRGLTPEQSIAIALVRWYLYRYVENPEGPWSFEQQRHWAEKPSLKIIKDEPIGPVLYDKHFSWDGGGGVQKGWGARR